MFNKRIKTYIMSCVLICILPTVSYAISKDDFLKFLVNSSYPEAKEEVKEDEKKESNSKDEEYIEFFIGEENIPTIKEENNSDEGESKETSNEVASNYTNNIRITKEKPTMMIYHSHASESYSDYPENNYRCQDNNKSIVSVGSLLTEELNKKGWGVVHSTKYHDFPDYNSSYSNSLKTINSIMSEHNSIDIAIDLHRDARTLDTKAKKDKETNRMVANYNGEEVAKFLFVVGQRNPNVKEVRALANDITNFAKQKYPDLVLPVIEKPYGKFNQYVADNHILIEVGSNGTTLEQAQNSVKYIANILDEYFKEKK